MNDLLEKLQKLSNPQTQSNCVAEDEELSCKNCSMEISRELQRYYTYHFSDEIKVPMCSSCIDEMLSYEQKQTQRARGRKSRMH